MADPIVHITNGIPDSGTGNISTLGMLMALFPPALGAGGGLKIDGSGTALPISGTVSISGGVAVTGAVTANAGTNLNTSALAVESGGNLAQIVTTLGAVTVSPTANTIGDRLKSINTTLGSPLQAGGNIGNSVFGASQSGTWTVQPGNTPNTSPWLVTINDGTNSATVKAASTPAAAADKSLVVAISPNSFGNNTMANSFPVTLASNQSAFPVTVASTTITGTVAVTESGTWVVGANSATGSAVPANAFFGGGIAKTALPAAATDGNLAGVMLDKFGRQVVIPGTIRDLVGTQTTTLSASTAETTIVTAGGANVFDDLSMLVVSNTSAATNTRIDFRDTTGGSVLFSLMSIGGGPPVGFAPPIPIPQTSANTNWTAQCATSTTDVRIYALFQKNK